MEWPKDTDGKTSQHIPPHGVKHHYAPLAVIADADTTNDCRHLFKHYQSWHTDYTNSYQEYQQARISHVQYEQVKNHR